MGGKGSGNFSRYWGQQAEMVPVLPVRKLVEARGISQKDLAKAMGVSRQAVNLWWHRDVMTKKVARNTLEALRRMKISPRTLAQREAAALTASRWWSKIMHGVPQSPEQAALGRACFAEVMGYTTPESSNKAVWDAKKDPLARKNYENRLRKAGGWT